MPTRILAAVDFSLPSGRALEASYVLAERFNADVHVLHATVLPPYIEPGLAVRIARDGAESTVESLAIDAAEASLDRLLSQHPAPHGVSVVPEVRYGEPLDVIDRQARGFDLVVVGTHGRTGLDHLFVGSMAERIVRHVDRPVLVARDLPTTPRRILVPVDFSDPSRAAFRLGIELSENFEAELHLLHVVPMLPALEAAELMVVDNGFLSEMPLHDYAQWRAEEDLRRFLRQAGSARPVSIDVRVGDPAQEIVETAKAVAADLLVMGTHGEQAWAWVGVGSVAEHVVREAPCSVLTTRWGQRGRSGLNPAAEERRPASADDSTAVARSRRSPV